MLIDYSKLKLLFTNRHARTIYSRQTDVLLKLVTIYERGVPSSDYEELSELLDCIEAVVKEGGKVLLQPLEDLIQKIRHHQTTMDSQYGTQKLVNVLSKFIHSNANHSDFVDACAKSLYLLLGGDEDSQPVVIHFNKKQTLKDTIKPFNTELSDLYVLNFLFLVIKEMSVPSLGLLKCIKRITGMKPICNILIENQFQFDETMDYVELLLMLLSKNVHMNLIFSMLDNLYMHAPVQVSQLLCKHFTAIASIIGSYFAEGMGYLDVAKQPGDLQVATELLLLVLRSLEGDAPPHDSIFRIVETYIEYLYPSTSVPQFLISSMEDSGEDAFCLYRLLHSVMEKQSSAVPQLYESKLEFFLSICKSSEESIDFNPKQIRQMLILKTLIVGTVFHLLPSKLFLSLGGLETLLDVLNSAIGMTESIPSPTDTNASTIGVDYNDRSRLLQNLMGSIISTLLKVVTVPRVSQKAVSFLHLAIRILNPVTYEPKGNSYAPSILISTLLLCSQICSNPKSLKVEFWASGGVRVLVSYLRGITVSEQTETNAEVDEKTMLTALDCPKPTLVEFLDSRTRHLLIWALIEAIWSCTVGNSQTEEEFINLGGVEFILGLIQDLAVTPTLKKDLPASQDAKNANYVPTTQDLKTHAVGCLLDLLENPRTIQHVKNWKSASKDEQYRGMNISNLLIRMWKDEEMRMGKSVYESVGTFCQTTSNNTSNSEESSPTIADLGTNLCSKIYSVFSKLGFPDTGLTNTELIKLEQVT